MQASCSLHSELPRHSGRQDGGEPTWPARHEQAVALLGLTVHSLYGPQGDGEQGDCEGSEIILRKLFDYCTGK